MGIVALARETVDGVLDLVYPPKCLVCGAVGGVTLCADCRAAFEPVAEPLCGHCGGTQAYGQCGDCLRGAAQHIAAARAAGRFAGPLREAIVALKYIPKRRLAEPLGEFLGEFLVTSPFGRSAFDAVVPVPLHASRLREREFNQAALLAAHAARAVGTPMLEGCLVRTRRTRKQTDLRAEQRAANVRGAFAVTDPAALTGKTILLIDDVVTTFSTTDACAHAMVGAGARRIYVAALARGG